MSNEKRISATGAIDALLRSWNGFLTYDVDFKIENNWMLIMNLEKEKISIYTSIINEKHGSAKSMRININKEILDTQRDFKKKKGSKSAFIGWFKNSEILVAWDPRHALSLSPSPGSGSSINAGLELKHNTTRYRPSIYKANPKEMEGPAFVIAMHFSMLTFYLKNMENLHSMNNEEEIISAMEHGTTDMESSFLSSAANLSEIPPLYWVKLGRRNPEFRKSVLKAYDNACCICGKKLGIVEAAHIIPFASDHENNYVANGLALCVEHHVLYDKAILMPDHNYKLVFNEMKAKELRKAGLSDGLREVKKLAGKRITLPKQKKDWPNKEGLQRGMEERNPSAIPKP